MQNESFNDRCVVTNCGSNSFLLLARWVIINLGDLLFWCIGFGYITGILAYLREMGARFHPVPILNVLNELPLPLLDEPKDDF